MGDAASFARQHGFFFVEVKRRRDEDGALRLAGEGVDNVFFAIAATLLDNAKRELAIVHKDMEGTSPLVGQDFMQRFTPEAGSWDADDIDESVNRSNLFASFEYNETDSALLQPSGNSVATGTIDEVDEEEEDDDERPRRYGSSGQNSESSNSGSLGEVPTKLHKYVQCVHIASLSRSDGCCCVMYSKTERVRIAEIKSVT